MTEQEKRLVRESFALIEPRAELAGLLFYQRLFTTTPELQRRFQSDIEVQAGRVLSAMKAVVASLEDEGSMRRHLALIADRHGVDGADDAQRTHLEHFREAWIWMMGQLLEGRFTVEAREAWRSVYRMFYPSRPCAETPAESNASFGIQA